MYNIVEFHQYSEGFNVAQHSRDDQRHGSISGVTTTIWMECRGGNDDLTTDNLVSTGKWSVGEKRVVVRDGARKESEELIITRSRM